MITEKALPFWRMPPFSDTLGKLNLARNSRNGSAVLFGRFLVVDSSFGMACFRMFEGKTLDSKQGHVQNHRFWYRVLTVLQHTHVKKWRWPMRQTTPKSNDLRVAIDDSQCGGLKGQERTSKHEPL